MSYRKIVKRIVNKISLYKLFKQKYKNSRECPFYSEWKGIEQTLEMLGIKYEYEFDDECNIIAVIVEGEKEEII